MGAQKYPQASTTAWYQEKYPGTGMEPDRIVLHTTESTALPGYQGGAIAPNLTAVPDLRKKRLTWYQHFDFGTSSRALADTPGGVRTNRQGAAQVELVGTCDPVTHDKWRAAGHGYVFWPEAPEWALEGLAAFLRWAHGEHGIPLSGPEKWPPYPESYGNGGGQRLGAEEWESFRGICGHMHVPENDHGDPGALAIGRLLELAGE
ncbi:hypothetical protein [Streptomyces sp. YIM 98790]|uniref:hypothetical protein n=1 Tax=Streptomyces sp. YIM 98790 TaxID=2689077 RepID=UPI00140CF19F|nr:hypothetical protein [Streptomyces sp. YIM 98790]